MVTHITVAVVIACTRLRPGYLAHTFLCSGVLATAAFDISRQMEVAKRLDFDPTDTLNGLQDPSQQRFQTANMAALQELQQAVKDLSTSAKSKHAQIMTLAQQTTEQGIGDNDLKRLQRQFDSNKATFVNVDQKQRFMKGLWDMDLDIEHLTTVKDDQELQLERGAETLRTLKAKNEQARQKLKNTCGSISQLYGFMGQATEATAAQLDCTRQVLQQQAAKQASVAAELPLDPGPDQVEAQQLVEAEAVQARELERSIAAAETRLSELEATAAAEKQDLVALRSEVAHLETLAANRSKAADSDKHVKDATAWCLEMVELTSRLTGVTLEELTDYYISIGIRISVPLGRHEGHNGPCRFIDHTLTLWLKSSDEGLLTCSNLDRFWLESFKLAPAVCDIDAIVLDNEHRVKDMVREVRGSLLSYWRRRVLVEAAAEAFPPSSSARGPPHIRASLPHQVEVEVLVPLSWPSSPSDTLQVVELAVPDLGAEAAQALMQRINANSQLLASCDVAGLLQHVAAAVDAELLEAAANA